MRDYALLFEKKFLMMSDAERLKEMRRISRQRLNCKVMLALMLAILNTRP